MTDKEYIKTFVQKTLGCGCPEEVFRHIEYYPDKSSDDIVLRGKINIGNRLLIYLVDITEIDHLERTISFLIEKGKKERDGAGFNRFRLVLITENPVETEKIAYQIFNSLDKDEKVHLHIVSQKDIPVFSQ